MCDSTLRDNFRMIPLEPPLAAHSNLQRLEIRSRDSKTPGSHITSDLLGVSVITGFDSCQRLG